MKKQAGFTLIELVMVIVILGILAAVALPKFVNLGSDARVAAVKGLEGSMRSANSIIYAKANVANMMGLNATVTVAGQDVLTSYGFANNADELKKVMDLSNDFGIGSDQYGLFYHDIIYHRGAADINGARCEVWYAPSAGTNSVPAYTVTTAGC